MTYYDNKQLCKEGFRAFCTYGASTANIVDTKDLHTRVPNNPMGMVHTHTVVVSSIDESP